MLAMFMSIILLAACGQTPASTPDNAATGEDVTDPQISGAITVFAAASLTESYTELGNAFEAAYPGTSVTFNFAGSQQLAQQLGQGAPADVFASANTKQMGVAISAGRIISETQQIFAHNRLVAIVSNDSPIPVTSLEALATPDLKIILAAQEVPVGGYTQTFLDKASEEESLGADYKTAVVANVVSYEQTVKAVLTKVVLGEGDAGIVYSSDITEEAAQHLSTIAIPDQLNTIATYPIAIVNDTANRETAQAFIDYLLSPDGQAILTKHGFQPTDSDS
jgi:molybdate transport system substrate-binding protein